MKLRVALYHEKCGSVVKKHIMDNSFKMIDHRSAW